MQLEPGLHDGMTVTVRRINVRIVGLWISGIVWCFQRKIAEKKEKDAEKK